VVLVIVIAALASAGARCIEQPSVQVDKDGYTHLTGRMVNETDTQGTELMLRGTLYDAQNNVIAQKDAPPCPPDLSPNSEVMFDIRFDNPNVPPHDHFDVRLVSGKALPAKLPNPDVVLFRQEAFRYEGLPPIPGLGITDNDVLFAFNARNRSQNTYPVQGCAVVLDNQSRVIAAVNEELVQIDENNVPSPATLDPSRFPVTVFMIAKDVPAGPVQVKAWLWFGSKDDPTSPYAYVSTQLFTIQTVSFP
jgi:hypothetical protein